MHQPLTLDTVRADIAEQLFLEPEEVSSSENLLLAGMDSVAILELVERWRANGAAVTFSDLAENPTLDQWWALLSGERSHDA